jgi:hypothetical protein
LQTAATPYIVELPHALDTIINSHHRNGMACLWVEDGVDLQMWRAVVNILE